MPDEVSDALPSSAEAAPRREPPATTTRHVTRRDGRLEGEPDVEPDAGERMAATKERQRDLTSLSGPVPGDDK